MHPAPKADLRSLFEQALELPPIDRANFLRDLQFKSPILYKQLRSLLFAHEGPSAFFEQDGGLWAQITPTDLTGRRFGAYSIVSEIGRGGMGAVYKASRADEAFHKTVAIKLISGGAILSGSDLDCFRRERQILAQLEHPNIARLLDGGSTDDGFLYLIMEFVDGLPLDKYIESNKSGVEEILKLFIDVTVAVSFAHRNLVVHRDLKPSNILVTESGEVKLLDFGIAKVLNPDRNDTATIAVRLTPEFASPEQIRGQAISTASDVYSLGVLLFHVLTGGAKPYRATSQAVPDILQAVLDSEVPRPSSVAPQAFARKLRGDLDNIILKAMAKEPERRYASVDQLREDINRHLNGRPILAQADNWSYRFGKFIRRHRFAASAAALLLLTIAAGTLTTLQQASIAHDQRSAAESARAIAEDQRKAAESQRQLAILSQRQADKQRLLAEQRTQEALTERGRAESQRASAETRYQSVRSLATAILFDVNESLRDIPGSGPARKQAVLAALKHLEALAQKSGDDLALTEDLATAYEQTADIMDSLFEDSREAASLAIPALLKAVRLRTRLTQNPKAGHTESIRLAETLRRLGNSQLNALQAEAAIKSYTSSLFSASISTPSRDSLRVVALARSNLCTANTIQGNHKAALPECREAVRVLDSIVPSTKSDIPRLRILTRLRYGNALRREHQPAAALAEFRAATEAFDPLDTASAPILAELLSAIKSASPNESAQRLLALAFRKQGVLNAKTGQRDQSLESFEQAMRFDTAAAPPMKEVILYADACIQQAEAVAQHRNGQVRQAIEASKKALSRLGESSSGSASLLRSEIEESIRSFELTLAQPPQ